MPFREDPTLEQGAGFREDASLQPGSTGAQRRPTAGQNIIKNLDRVSTLGLL